MAHCTSENFGSIEYDTSSVINFPRGLPGFESEKQFVPVEREGSHPVLFLQSLATPRLCFITLPVESIDPGYQVQISDEDRTVVGTECEAVESLRCLAIVCTAGCQPTANLLGPLVINSETGQAVQAVRDDARYAVNHPLFSETEIGECL